MVLRQDLYHAAFPRDAILIKAFVYSVHLIETAKSIVMVYDAYDIFATGFSDRESLHGIHHIWFTCCVINGLGKSTLNICNLDSILLCNQVAFIVQILYAYRIKVLSTSYIWGIIIALVRTPL